MIEKAYLSEMLSNLLGQLLKNVESVTPIDNTRVSNATAPIYNRLSNLIDFTVQHLTDNNLDPTGDNIISATQAWCRQENVELEEAEIPAEVEDNDESVRLRINSIDICNFAGVGPNFDPLNELAEADVLIFRGKNGSGKSTLCEAIMRQPGNVTAGDTFINGVGPSHVNIGFSRQENGGWEPVDQAFQPKFRNLGKSISLVYIPLSDFADKPIKITDYLAAVTGSTRLNNQCLVATRLANRKGNAGQRLVNLMPNDQAVQVPPEVTNHFNDWMYSLNQYRQFSNTPRTGPIRTDLAYWNQQVKTLSEELGIQNWQDLTRETWEERQQRFEAMTDAVQNLAPPQALTDAQVWLNNFTNQANLAIQAYNQPNQNLTDTRINLLNAIVAARALTGLNDNENVTALEVVNLLRAELGDLEPLPVVEAPALAQAAIEVIQEIKERANQEKIIINERLQAIDTQRQLMMSSLAFLENQQNTDQCPVCNQAIVQNQLIINLRAAIAEPNPETAELENNRNTLNLRIQSSEGFITSITQKSRSYVAAKNALEQVEQQLQRVLQIFVNFPDNADALTTPQLPLLINAARRINIDDPQMNRLAVVTANCDIAHPVLEAIGTEIANFGQVQEEYNNRVRSWRLLAEVIDYDLKLSQAQWSNQAAAVTENQIKLAVVEKWIQASNEHAAVLQNHIDNLDQQLLNNNQLQAHFNYYRDMANHDFFPTINGENGDATRLSEGYRVLYALAAVMAVASVPTPGNDADFIILDEPTQKLDPTFRKHLAQFLGTYCPKQLIFMTYEDTFANDVVQLANTQDKTVQDFTLDWTLNLGTTWQLTNGGN